MLKRILAVAVGWFALAGMQPAPPPPPAGMALWRLDCGTVEIGDLDFFSDTFLYAGRKKTLTDSCYLIRHGDQYLLWDTGFPAAMAGRTTAAGSMSVTVRATLVDQLARIGVTPAQVTFVGISHRHDDHTGQAASFPAATLLIGAEDFEAMKKGDSAARLAPWIEGGGKVKPVRGDHDVFGDGSVVMLDMPGHTEGHHSLLVRLQRTGPILLTGDLYHFTEAVRNRSVPSFNTDRADTLASMDRFDAIARNLHAKVIIQHEPDDIAKLPPFPEAAQ